MKAFMTLIAFVLIALCGYRPPTTQDESAKYYFDENCYDSENQFRNSSTNKV